MTADTQFTFIDLFAGIGGMRLAFEHEDVGGKCLWSCDRDKFARLTYQENHLERGGTGVLRGDIDEAFHVGETRSLKDVTEDGSIPEHDVLLAGFPCQPFSLAGVSKKNSLNRPHGFDDPSQGTLFERIVEVLQARRPAAFLLENVRNIRTHNRGETIQRIRKDLDGCGYFPMGDVRYRILDASHVVPQHRERVFFVGFRSDVDFSWHDFDLSKVAPRRLPVLRDILHRPDNEKDIRQAQLGRDGDVDRFFDPSLAEEDWVKARYTTSDAVMRVLERHKKTHAEKGNGFGFGLVTGDVRARTLSARYHKDGAEILVEQSHLPHPDGSGRTRNPRRLTPRECARLMGFPEEFRIPKSLSDTQAYRQFGNSVVVPLVTEIARFMKPFILEAKSRR